MFHILIGNQDSDTISQQKQTLSKARFGVLESKHSLLQSWMHGVQFLLLCMLRIVSLQACITLLHTCALGFLECSYIFILFSGTSYHICIVIMHARKFLVGVFGGVWWL